MGFLAFQKLFTFSLTIFYSLIANFLVTLLTLLTGYMRISFAFMINYVNSINQSYKRIRTQKINTSIVHIS